ncbi:nitroreductase/quinone reductase family protein [Mycobacterium sp. CVI_P3]|uniref:Nitroreductase/quinone reductase family protein n=1 Tax=Mycobacterium pinniadriaticum TaxID=2994102 RepID=A0ABT3SJG1_9MYCO|nr:nitroreductase/quinone reductase family protein [Mycobacterium pinniadriaticum]MCX2933219.1 nitroreductase/quinone reductase family protein [Mycobacterium pinniadriaticum]MCX2939641.1 nitroreductase/quinone reductase family protein [Mycobacterium pinniadriaticum]
MAYLKPPWFTVKVFNKIAMATGLSGTETLTVTARTTGHEQKIPVITVEVDGTRYLVSTRGESQWVKNVRANPAVGVATKSGSARFTAAELPVAERAPVLQAYRVKAGKTVDGYFAKLPDPADHPVFSLTPA